MLRTASAILAERVGAAVPVGYIAGGEPRVASVVASARPSPGARVALVTWLLAPGAFHRWLADAGAEVVADPEVHDVSIGDDVQGVPAILENPHVDFPGTWVLQGEGEGGTYRYARTSETPATSDTAAG